MRTLATIFDRIESAPVADMVVQQIEDLIVQGVLAEGDRLPSERELSAQLNISRPKLRDALKQLEARRLITVQHGEGTFVARLTGQAMQPALIDLYARHGKAFFDYLEYRRAQEAFASRLAAERATATDRDRIQRHLDAIREADARGDMEAGQEADVRFHSVIVEASHNAMLVHMMSSIYDLTRRGVFYNRAYLRTLDGTGEKLLAQHIEIANAILAGDGDSAESAAKVHLDFVERSFRVGEQQSVNERVSQKREGLVSE
ncbi:FadR/GntR family transcriptional regulator [Shimia sp. MMG029]|uniref:FadR/GntR family transcriptional regulator n=1 Tax=Shimia sp. MMG029 TaxID=3021978 RepID=UPI0022FE778B|nr:FadR/GntR family transcriptional regulator [Shimia sp. MMG029]MDA5557765.1 FadR/GntR family transcriptional regulator [Shimia sp. MMG029]